MQVIKDNPNVHSWFTKSQLDLFNQNQSNLERPSTHNAASETTNKLEQSKSVTYIQTVVTNRENEISGDKLNTGKVPKSSAVLKPKIPPPPPPSKNRTASAEVESDDGSMMVSNATDIPRTGFDFLDNW